jgi:hypothetical protein
LRQRELPRCALRTSIAGRFSLVPHSRLVPYASITAEPPAEGNLMSRLDMLIAKNQNLLPYKDIDNLIKETLVDVF